MVAAPTRTGVVSPLVAGPAGEAVEALARPADGTVSAADAVRAPLTTSAVATGSAAAAERALLSIFLRML